ncbi:MAG: hypothetical protein H6907_05025 [Hyphomicrobiales bacterium]|nr:hypothetical protein [Hyphomicrobiales bacterium]MCP5371077.1 hypothetical protein [Hyphomicrobiales bacterium]
MAAFRRPVLPRTLSAAPAAAARLAAVLFVGVVFAGALLVGDPAGAARVPAPAHGPDGLQDERLPGEAPSPFADPVYFQHKGLSRQLDRASRERSEEARRALLANPATRGLLDGPRPLYQGFDYAACRVAPTPACLLDEAVATAQRIEKSEVRDWVLGEILAAQAAAGLADKTWQTARRIDDPGMVMVALANIAKSHANAGRFDAAAQAADILPDPLLRQDVYLHMAEAQLGLGEREAARRTVVRAQNEASRIYDTRDRVRLHARMAAVLERAGEPAGAHRALAVASHEAESLSDAAARDSALRHLALAHIEAGRIERALDLLARIHTDDERTPVLVRTATARAETGSPAQALDLAARIDQARYRAQVLGRIAQIQAKAGHMDDARRTAERALHDARVIELPYARAFALHSIVDNLTDGDAAIDLARSASAEIGNGRLRVRALWAIADSLARRGDTANADRARAEATDAMAGLRNPADRAWLYGEMAQRLSVTGDGPAARTAFERGLAAVDGIAAPSARARVLGHLAQTLLALNGTAN